MSETLALWAYSRILWRVGRSLGPRRLGQGHLQRAPQARPSLMASPFRIFQVDESMHGESVRRSTDRCKQKLGATSRIADRRSDGWMDGKSCLKNWILAYLSVNCCLFCYLSPICRLSVTYLFVICSLCVAHPTVKNRSLCHLR